MMLRASTEALDTDVDMSAIVDGEVDSGIPDGAALSAFTEALVRRSADLTSKRGQLLEAVGPAALVEAAGTAANFQRMTRIADAIGIPLDRDGGEQGAAFRAEIGIDAFAGAENSSASS